jgi:hypothetical protein
VKLALRPDGDHEIDRARVPVPARCEFRSNQAIGFRLGAYDRARPLTIDPVLIYSTFL